MDGLGSLQEADELPSTRDRGRAHSLGRSASWALASMRSKLFDYAVIDLGDGNIGLIEPVAEMPGHMPEIAERALPIALRDEMIEIRFNQRPQRAGIEGTPLSVHHCKR